MNILKCWKKYINSLNLYHPIKLPSELFLFISEGLDSKDIFNLCLTSKQYNLICKPDYDRLWLTLFNRVVRPMYVYSNVHEYNNKNNTTYKHWLEAYVNIKKCIKNVSEDLLISTCENGHVELVKVLLSDPRISKTTCEIKNVVYYDPILLCLSCSYPDVIKLLLSDPGINPSINNNLPIICASKRGSVEGVRMLLSDSRVDPSDQNNKALINACDSGLVEMVELLLSDPRVNPSDCDNEAAIKACERGYTKIIKLLLLNSRFDPSVGNNKLICRASSFGRIEILKLLLQDPRVNPADINGSAIMEAIAWGHTEVVELLLSDSRVDPYDNNVEFGEQGVYMGIAMAYSYGRKDILTFLMERYPDMSIWRIRKDILKFLMY